MSNCNWEEIESFQSPEEFNRFVQWIEEQISNGTCEELKELGKIHNEWDERKFKCKETGEVWRLSYPDPGYFSGSWLPTIIK